MRWSLDIYSLFDIVCLNVKCSSDGNSIQLWQLIEFKKWICSSSSYNTQLQYLFLLHISSCEEWSVAPRATVGNSRSWQSIHIQVYLDINWSVSQIAAVVNFDSWLGVKSYTKLATIVNSEDWLNIERSVAPIVSWM